MQHSRCAARTSTWTTLLESCSVACIPCHQQKYVVAMHHALGLNCTSAQLDAADVVERDTVRLVKKELDHTARNESHYAETF